MNLKLGKSGEKKAEKYLIKKGYNIIEKNFACKLGEIDLIVEKDGVIVFVEVKTRNSTSYGYGFESVNSKKIEKIRKVATYFLVLKNIDKTARFDVISIDSGKITHLTGAF